MERICNNIYFQNVVSVDSLIYTTPYSKKLSFSTCYIHSMMEHFDDQVVMDMDMSNGCCNIVFDASIGDY